MHSDATRAKISAALMGHAVSSVTRHKIGRSIRGRKATLGTRSKMSAALMGHATSAPTRLAIGAAKRRDGATIGYHAVHRRLRIDRGPASATTCACGAPARQWAYRGDCPFERWEAKGDYFLAFSPDLSRYDALCVRCHARQGPPLLAMLAERASERAVA